jgi:hypothetical protein
MLMPLKPGAAKKEPRQRGGVTKFSVQARE